jgi:hypothetical protein
VKIVIIKRLAEAGAKGEIIFDQEEWNGIKVVVPTEKNNFSQSEYNSCVFKVMNEFTEKLEAENATIPKKMNLNNYKLALDRWISFLINGEFEDAVAMSAYPFKAQFLQDLGNPANPESSRVKTEIITDDHSMYRALRSGIGSHLSEIERFGVIRPSMYNMFPRSSTRVSMFSIGDNDAVGIIESAYPLDLHVFIRQNEKVLSIIGYAYEISLRRLCRTWGKSPGFQALAERSLTRSGR